MKAKSGWTVIFAIAMASTLNMAASASDLPKPTHHADPFTCGRAACAMPHKGSYPYLIIGRYEKKASAQQSQKLFASMRAHQRWKALPDDAVAFHQNLQPVAIRLPDGSTLAVLMTQEEFRVSRPQPGDMVRYSPHRGAYEIPPKDPKARAYWSVDGCVAVLCRVGDKTCHGRYKAGVYRPKDGAALSPVTFAPLAKAVSIDPDSLLPKTGPAASAH